MTGTSHLELSHGVLQGNCATRGAALLLLESASAITRDTRWEGNQANRGEAVFPTSQAHLSIMGHSVLVHNVAHQEGGAIYMELEGFLVLENSTFEFNSAAGVQSYGGGHLPPWKRFDLL